MNIDKKAAIWAAVICVGVAGIIVLIAWCIGPRPGWIRRVIPRVVALAVLYYPIYTLIETR